MTSQKAADPVDLLFLILRGNEGNMAPQEKEKQENQDRLDQRSD